MAEEIVDKSKILRSIFHTDDQISFEVTDDILALGNFLGNHYEVLRSLYKAYRKLELTYDYKPKIGASLSVHFDYGEDRSVTFERQSLKVKLSEADFLIFMAKVDAIYGEILPVGSVVELDETMLPYVIQEQVKNSGIAELVVLVGRKISLQEPFDRYIIDYYGYLWPIGQLATTPPITISNMMIKRVVHKGFEHPLDETFSMDVLRATQLARQQISTSFMPVEEGLAFYEQYTDLPLKAFLADDEKEDS